VEAGDQQTRRQDGVCIVPWVLAQLMLVTAGGCGPGGLSSAKTTGYLRLVAARVS